MPGWRGSRRGAKVGWGGTIKNLLRQGCPLSGVLFVLGIELFSKTLKKDPTIRGIKVNKCEIKVTQYADDTTVFVRDLDSVNSLLHLLNEFHTCSGLEMNTTKTEAMWLGKWKNRKDTPFANGQQNITTPSAYAFLTTKQSLTV